MTKQTYDGVISTLLSVAILEGAIIWAMFIREERLTDITKKSFDLLEEAQRDLTRYRTFVDEHYPELGRVRDDISDLDMAITELAARALAPAPLRRSTTEAFGHSDEANVIQRRLDALRRASSPLRPLEDIRQDVDSGLDELRGRFRRVTGRPPTSGAEDADAVAA
jgi:hypothetical protein